MNKEAILVVLQRVAENDKFTGQLTDNFVETVKDYELIWEEQAALYSRDIHWIEAHICQVDKHLRTWLNCRLQQEK